MEYLGEGGGRGRKGRGTANSWSTPKTSCLLAALMCNMNLWCCLLFWPSCSVGVHLSGEEKGGGGGGGQEKRRGQPPPPPPRPHLDPPVMCRAFTLPQCVRDHLSDALLWSLPVKTMEDQIPWPCPSQREGSGMQAQQMAQSLQLGRAQVLRGLRHSLNTDQIRALIP